MTNYPQSFLVPDPHLTTCAFKLLREKNPHLKEARILSERLDEFLSRERHSDRYNFRNCSVSIRLFFVVVTKCLGEHVESGQNYFNSEFRVYSL